MLSLAAPKKSGALLNLVYVLGCRKRTILENLWATMNSIYIVVASVLCLCCLESIFSLFVVEKIKLATLNIFQMEVSPFCVVWSFI